MTAILLALLAISVVGNVLLFLFAKDCLKTIDKKFENELKK